MQALLDMVWLLFQPLATDFTHDMLLHCCVTLAWWLPAGSLRSRATSRRFAVASGRSRSDEPSINCPWEEYVPNAECASYPYLFSRCFQAPAPCSPAQLEAGLQAARLPYYSGCELTVYRKSAAAAGRKGEGEPSKLQTIFLTMQLGQEKSSAFRRDDLWVVGSHPELEPAAGGPCRDRHAAPWVAVMRSCWHGPNRKGR